MGVLSEGMDQDPETSFRVSEAPRCFLAAQTLDEKGAESFVLSVGGILRFEEETSHAC